MLAEVEIIVIFLGNFMFISFPIFSFFIFCFPFGLKAMGSSLPLAIAVGVEDSSLDGMVRGGSVISSFVGSQPSVFSQEEVATPICDEDPVIVAAPAVKPHQDDLLVRVFYDSLAGGKTSGDPRRVLKSMAERGNCAARLAVAILYKTGKENFEMGEEEVFRNLEAAYPIFLSYENTSPATYEYWNRLLVEHGLRK